MSQFLLAEEFMKFKNERSVEKRSNLTATLCDEFNQGTFKGEEIKVVKEIINHLSRDVEKKIRATLAGKLKENNDLPHEAAVRLANDNEEDVATPILEYSEVLTDEDLTQIIASTEVSGMLNAIAKRKTVSETVSARLVDKGNEGVVTTLVQNKGAQISDETSEKIVDDFSGSESVLTTLVNRGGLCTNVAEKMMTLVSTNLQEKLIKKYDIDPAVVKKAVKHSEEKITWEFSPGSSNEERDVADIIENLVSTKRLTPFLLMKALGNADLEFFIAGMAKLAGIPEANASKLIYQGNSLGFTSFYKAASMPADMLEATQKLLSLVIEANEKQQFEQGQLAQYLISRIKEYGYDTSVPNMDKVMALIGTGGSFES